MLSLLMPASVVCIVLQEYQFRNIQRSEWQHLFEFIHSKKIRVENLAAAKAGPMGGGAAIDLGDELDAGMRAARAEAGDWLLVQGCLYLCNVSSCKVVTVTAAVA